MSVTAESATSDEADGAAWNAEVDYAASKARETWKAADDADNAVVELIRRELQGRSQPLGDWQALPERGSFFPHPDADTST